MFFPKMPIKPVLIYPALNNCTDWSSSQCGVIYTGKLKHRVHSTTEKTCIENLPQVLTLREAPPLATGPPGTRTHFSLQGKNSSPESVPSEGK